MIDRRYHRSLQVFTWLACGAMTAKLVLFTDFNTRRPKGEEHVFTGLQRYADRKLDEFFGVDAIADAPKDQSNAQQPSASN
ncbi:TPA: hypothetical protein N0F65_008944 [Lagenidium giganteum]|uniref:Uncharacterized protein n=1 Tax=Lagenidium giganteum TaxID=4803 RepID=A0AAV2YXV7_9STRA|nr:TPA: hypothetical protein N0F65_008944 [Lagenidium giganteum]